MKHGKAHRYSLDGERLSAVINGGLVEALLSEQIERHGAQLSAVINGGLVEASSPTASMSASTGFPP